MINYEEIETFLKGLDYSIDAPNPKEKYPVWRISKYEDGDFHASSKTRAGLFLQGLHHLLCGYMGQYWERVHFTPQSLAEWLGVENAPIAMTAMGYVYEIHAGEILEALGKAASHE
jgi:hypothetical protein